MITKILLALISLPLPFPPPQIDGFSVWQERWKLRPLVSATTPVHISSTQALGHNNLNCPKSMAHTLVVANLCCDHQTHIH